MSRDANQIAQEVARREQTRSPWVRDPAKVWGTLTIWKSLWHMREGEPWAHQSEDVTVDLSKPGVIITYDENNDAELFYPLPGWYVNFVPNRDEGE